MILARVVLCLAFTVVAHATDFTTPTRQLPVESYPHFHDDQQLFNFESAIQRQLTRFAQHPVTGTIRLGARRYSLAQVPASLRAFEALLNDFRACRDRGATVEVCDEDLNAQLRRHFDVFVPDVKAGDPRFGQSETALFTVYDTHTIEAQDHASGDFVYPIFGLPPIAADARKTRAAIDFRHGLSGKNLELTYGSSLFEIYMAQIEGSGFARLPDGSGVYLTFAGSNKQKWNWISRYMMTKGYIDNPSTAAQRRFLRQHPELAESIFSSCPSYVFFKPAHASPVGSEGATLTEGRSLATDHKLYPFKGLLTFVESRRPVETGAYDFEQEDASLIPFAGFQRFFLDQDTGGAIKGKARADLYFGIGTYAEFAASFENNPGRIYFLMLKDRVP